MIYLGIDPGKSGAIALLLEDGDAPVAFPLKDTDQDINELLGSFDDQKTAMLELVHSMPKQGVASSFTFGQSYGFLKGLLTAHKIPYRLATPQVWQRAMGCLSRGNKNATKEAAQRLWPHIKITHATADAMLLAEYCRRTWRT